MSAAADVRGLACPQPVIRTRVALQAHDAVTTIVDNATSQQNVRRTPALHLPVCAGASVAEQAGCTVQAETRADGIYLEICKQGAATVEAAGPPAAATAAGPLVLTVPSEYMGHGNEDCAPLCAEELEDVRGEGNGATKL